ncbi:MAG TPA: ABC transporter ATP-binding protein [Desulfobacterales bacterium]|nr:ABC transporter ATP-binding protein [Desulfobacterales bacterium]
MLELKDVHTYYGNIHALKGISCAIPAGDIACLIGANGAGKSTTLLTIFGVQRAKQGEIRFKGHPIHHLRPEQVAAKGISQTPEGRQIFPRMTTMENLEMGAYLRNDKEEVAKDLEWVLGLFPVLKDRTRQLGGTLSGGEQQMLAIGRALMSRPELLLLDEPSLGLAPKLVEKIFETILEINKTGVTIFLVEQNAHMALSISNRGYVMETGQIVLTDVASRLLENEKIKKAYLGE